MKQVKDKIRMLSVGLLFVFGANSCAAKDTNSTQASGSAKGFPRWIMEEKIRAGFVLATSDVKYVALMRSLGFNTVIVAAELRRPERFDSAFDNYRKWAKKCKQEKMHIFLSYYWQRNPHSSESRPVVFSDGTIGVHPCPRDARYWCERLIYLCKRLARLSLEPDLQIDGIMLDCELYGDEKTLKRHYGTHTCFCDNCFSQFLMEKGYAEPQLPVVERGDRKRWLRKNNFIKGYFTFLEEEVEALASKFEKECHRINPSLLIAMYPTPRDWVVKAMARNFGTEELPLILFATDTYNRERGLKVPEHPIEQYSSEGMKVQYIAGFLLKTYPSDSLRELLPDACRKCSGYWLFTAPMLWESPRNRHYALADGSREQYRSVTKEANDEIDMFIGKTSTERR